MANEKERLSDKEVQCDYCPSKLGYIYSVETEDSYKAVAVCHQCKSTKVPEKRLHKFLRWQWPKDAATLKQEMQEAKKSS